MINSINLSKTYVSRIFKYGCMLLLLLAPFWCMAQCPVQNKAIAPGEDLVYDLHFNWKFIWVKCGTATMKTVSTTYNGQPALRTYLQTKGSKQADKLFMMRDTLLSYMTPDLVPLYFRKGALEGHRYNVDEVFYHYKNGKVSIDHNYLNRLGEWEKHKTDLTQCAFDMIAQLNRARSLSADDLKPGQKIKFQMAEGKRVSEKTLIFRRRDTFKADDGTKYKCLVLSFVEYPEGKEKEVITFYVTDDGNHLPVRLDLNLKFGSAKAFLNSAKGTKYPISAIIK